MKKIYRLEIYGYRSGNSGNEEMEMLPISDFYDNIKEAQAALHRLKILPTIDKVKYLDEWNVYSRNEEAEIVDYNLITKE